MGPHVIKIEMMEPNRYETKSALIYKTSIPGSRFRIDALQTWTVSSAPELMFRD